MWWRTREIDAPAERAWDLLVELDRWPDWGPTVRSADLGDGSRRLSPAARGHVHPVVGPALPFLVTEWDDGRRWAWRVGGVAATAHRVEALGPTRCRVGMAAPRWAPAYLPVLDLALRRIDRLLASPG